MRKPTLVIMAAGMGSRFGGLKQLTPVDTEGHFIMDFSIFDAIRAGFGQVVCIIKEEMKEDFENKIGRRLGEHIPVTYAYQRLEFLPAGFTVPEGRVKPLGTAHAILCAADKIKGPFAVINADDFYGREAFEAISSFLINHTDDTAHAMVGYMLKNTLTENGSVSRGVCQVNEQDYLIGITERTTIIKTATGAAFLEDSGQYTDLSENTIVSMNLWGFQDSVLTTMPEQFHQFLTDTMPKNPLKAEWYLPLIPAHMIEKNTGTIRVLKTDAQWYGVTYPQDLPCVVKAIAKLKQDGQYPSKLWEV